MKTRSARNRKLLALCLAAVMAVGLLAACGGGQSASSEGGSASSAPAAESSAAAESTAAEETATPAAETTEASQAAGSGDVVTLDWWAVGNTPPDNWEDMLSVLSDYTEEKIGVRMNVHIASWGEAGDRFNTIVNTGEDFDIMFVDSSNYNYNNFVTLGAAADITDLVAEVTPDLWNSIPQTLWDGVRIKGQIYAVPTYKDSSRTEFWGIDKLYVDKYNLDLSNVKTFADLDPIFRTIKEGEGESFYPHTASRSNPWAAFFYNYDDLGSGLGGLIGVSLTDPERKVVCTYEQEDILEQLDYLHQWYLDGITNPDANVIDETGTGHVNDCFLNAQGWPAAAAGWAAANDIEEYVLTPPIIGPVYTTSSIQGSLNMISANSPHKEEALKLLELMNTDPYFRTMCAYGPEGEGFEYVDDEHTTIRSIDVGWPWRSYQQGTFFILPNEEGAENAWDQVREQNESATNSTCLGFIMDNNGLEDLVATLNTTLSKYNTDLLVGASDPDEVVPKMLEDLRAVGLDDYIAEAQAQVDAYFAE